MFKVFDAAPAPVEPGSAEAGYLDYTPPAEDDGADRGDAEVAPAAEPEPKGVEPEPEPEPEAAPEREPEPAAEPEPEPAAEPEPEAAP